MPSTHAVKLNERENRVQGRSESKPSHDPMISLASSCNSISIDWLIMQPNREKSEFIQKSEFWRKSTYWSGECAWWASWWVRCLSGSPLPHPSTACNRDEASTEFHEGPSREVWPWGRRRTRAARHRLPMQLQAAIGAPPPRGSPRRSGGGERRRPRAALGCPVGEGAPGRRRPFASVSAWWERTLEPGEARAIRCLVDRVWRWNIFDPARPVANPQGERTIPFQVRRHISPQKGERRGL